MKHRKYISSKRWKERKRKFFEKHNKVCAKCGATKFIDLHHKTYKRMGNELDSDLLPLCRKHHKELHKHHKDVNMGLYDYSELYVSNRKIDMAKEMRYTSNNKRAKSLEKQIKSTNKLSPKQYKLKQERERRRNVQMKEFIKAQKELSQIKEGEFLPSVESIMSS